MRSWKGLEGTKASAVSADRLREDLRCKKVLLRSSLTTAAGQSEDSKHHTTNNNCEDSQRQTR